MAVLEKIRVKFGILITVLIALALLSFIIDPQTLRSAFDMISAENKVGEMDGKAISYQDFYEELNTISEIAKNSGAEASSEEQQAQMRDAAWQSIFDQEVFIPKTASAGIFVGKEEMLDLTQGENVSPLMLQQQMFYDENGNFSRERVVNFVQNIDADETGAYGRYWDFLEETIYRNQLYNKYGNLLTNSDMLSNVESARAIAEGNVTADVDYVLAMFDPAADTSIAITPAEIKSYYKEHKKLFKQPENRDIEYVMWEVVPSTEDYTATREEFDELLPEFKTTDNPKNFVTLNSDSKWNTYYFSEAELESTPEFKALLNAPVGTVSEVVANDEYYSAARVVDSRMMADSAHVYYKMFPVNDEAAADEFIAAQSKSVDLAQFTDMGWVTEPGLMQANIIEFNPAFDPQQKIVKVKIPTYQAVFVLYTSERTKPVKKIQFCTLLKKVLPSDDTYRDFQMKAVEFADACEGKYEKFSQIAKEQNLPVIPINNIVVSTRTLGPTDNAREVVYWVFDKKTKEGDVSDLKIVDNKYYFVTAVTKVRKEGFANINDVAPQIKTLLLGKKAVAAKCEEIKAKIAGKSSLEEIAEILGTTVSHNPGMSFGTMQYGQTDPMFQGAVAAADEGVINVAPGQFGAYVFQVSNRTTGNYFTDKDAATNLSRKSAYKTQMLQSILFEEADVKDNRARFF